MELTSGIRGLDNLLIQSTTGNFYILSMSYITMGITTISNVDQELRHRAQAEVGVPVRLPRVKRVIATTKSKRRIDHCNKGSYSSKKKRRRDNTRQHKTRQADLHEERKHGSNSREERLKKKTAGMINFEHE